MTTTAHVSFRVALVAATLLGTAALALPGPGPAHATTFEGRARHVISTCSHSSHRSSAPSYGWPVKPFHRQHPVRGFFGDPRLADKTFRGDNHGSFHFGVDVSAPDGTPVYATISGRVVIESHRPETVSVRADDGRTVFAYWHVVRKVENGQRVTAYQTVLGRIASGWGHVHFAESRDDAYLNPLRPGAMGPYADRTCPRLRNLGLERNGRVMRGSVATGTVSLVVEAFDSVPMAVPGAWAGKPVMPAAVAWRLVDRGRPATAWRTAFDVRSALPAEGFESVYARWTRQNSARRVGRYRLLLASEFDTTRIPDGSYLVLVEAVDTAGNTTCARFSLVVANAA